MNLKSSEHFWHREVRGAQVIESENVLEEKKFQFTTGVWKQKEDVPQTVICPCADHPYHRESQYTIFLNYKHINTYAVHVL